MKRIFFSLVLLPALAHAQIITTIAGNGMMGSAGDGGAATNAELFWPVAVAVDHSGNVYISNQDDRVRKVNTSGIITTIAGNAGHGYNGDGIPATDAKLLGPGGIDFDRSGNIYVTDGYNNRVRKIDTHGIITTIAGNGAGGYAGDGGAATAAELSSPAAVAVDENGNIFIADGSDRIRRVDTLGIITTIAGTGYGWPGGGGFSGDGGPATAAELHGLASMSVSNAHEYPDIFFVDAGNDRIRYINSLGIISTFAGGGAGGLGNGGPATAAGFLSPTGAAVDQHGNVYIVDEPNSSVRVVNTSGIISTFAGNYTGGFSGDGGPATDAQLYQPYGIAVDDSGNVYIDDLTNNRIRKVSQIPTKVDPLYATNGITDIYPNPAKNELIVSSSAPITSIQIFNVFGQLVKELTSIQNMAKRLRINIEDLPGGVYFIRLNNVKVGKFVKY